MKVSFYAISDIAYQILSIGIDGELGNLRTDLIEIEKAQFALEIKKALCEGKKRIVIDVGRPKE